MINYNKKLVSNARTLRKNMTPEEKHLWYDFLKRLPLNVRRQHNIEDYIVDFYIAEKKIVIEIDGIQHTSPEHKRADEVRDMALARWNISRQKYPRLLKLHLFVRLLLCVQAIDAVCRPPQLRSSFPLCKNQRYSFQYYADV